MNRMTRTLSILAVTAAVGVAALVVGAPAHAADETTVAKVKAEVTRRIDLRLAALTRFDATLTGAKQLTDSHESTLHDLVATDRSGLTALKSKVAGETTLAALKDDAKSMVDDYRVFLLVGPKIRLTIAGDAEAAAIAKLREVHTKLTELVAKAKTNGEDTAAAEQDLADMKAAIDKAAADIEGQTARLLGLQAGPDGTGIRAQVASVRAALHTGRADLKTAVAEAKHVRDFLKSVAK